MTSPLDILALARGKLADAQEAERANASEAAEHDAKAEAKRDEAERARAAHRAKAGADVLAGRTPADTPDPGTKAERAALAYESAAEHLAAQQPRLEAATRDAQGRVADAAVGAMRAMRDEARGEAQEALGALLGPLAGLLAAEMVRETLAPAPFAFDPVRHPPAELWSGAHAARALIGAVPPRLLPDGFSDAVEREASRRAHEAIERTGDHHG